MKPINQINDLIDKHGDTFVKCKGCSLCKKIEQLRIELDSSRKSKYQKILAKGQDMTKSEIQYLIDGGITRTEISQALKIDRSEATETFLNWGLSKKRVNKEKHVENEVIKDTKSFDSLKKTLSEYQEMNNQEVEEMGAKELTYEEYNRLKGLGKSGREIAKTYGIKENTLYTKVHAWKKASETLVDNNIVKALKSQIADLEEKVKGYPELIEKVDLLGREVSRLQDENSDLYDKYNQEVELSNHKTKANEQLYKSNNELKEENKSLHEQVSEWMEKAKNYAAYNASLDKGFKDTRQLLENTIGENEAFRTVLKKVL